MNITPSAVRPRIAARPAAVAPTKTEESGIPALAGGYPVVAGVRVDVDHASSGYVIAYSDGTSTTLVFERESSTAKVIRRMVLALITEARERNVLIRAWQYPIRQALIAAGAADLMDLPDFATKDDPAYQILRQAAHAKARQRLGRWYRYNPIRKVATDASRSRTGESAWSWVDDRGGYGAGTGFATSSTTAELRAIEMAVQSMSSDDDRLLIMSDSQRAIERVEDGRKGIFPEHLRETSDITKRIVKMIRGKRVRLVWVKGHAGHDLNDRADRLARHTRRAQGHEGEDWYQATVAQICDPEINLTSE